MKWKCLCLCLAACGARPISAAPDVGPTDPAFNPAVVERALSWHDPVWTAAPAWFDGAPLGNGDLGAMIWCRDDRLILSLDKTDLWETRNFQPDPLKYTWANYRKILLEKRAANSPSDTLDERRYFQRPRRKPMGLLGADEIEPPYVTRLPLGRLELRFTGKLRAFHMRLRLARARLEGGIVTSDGRLNWTIYVQAERPLIVLEWQASGTLKAHAEVRLAVDSASYVPAVCRQLRSWGYRDPARQSAEGIDSVTETMPAGGEYDVSTRTEAENPAHGTLFLTISHRTDAQSARSESRTRLAGLRPEQAGNLRSEHEAWWRRFYSRSFLTIPDTRLEGLYWLEMYKLASGTRPDKPPLGLEGPWTVEGAMPRYCGSYYWNEDTEMTYWPVFAANRLDFGDGLLRMIDGMRPNLRAFCRQFFGTDGEFLRIGTDMHGNSTYMSPTVTYEFNGLPWVCHLYWLYYRYTLDRDFLRRRAVPVMKAALAVYRSQLHPGPDGRLHLELSESPEYAPPGHPRWGPDATIDLALIRGLCGWLLQADEILQSHDPERGRWQEVMDRLAPYPRDSQGGLAVRADLALNSSHRHHSHLMPIYPLELINLQSDRALIESSIARWKFYGTGEWTGWSYGWGAAIAAHTAQPELARTLLLDYVDHFVSSSGMHMDGVRNKSYMTIWSEHNVLTLEAGFGAANAVQEMLLQSQDGSLRLFPAAPWPSAAFASLRGEGAFLVSARKNAGRLEFARITSLLGGPCRVLLPDDGQGLTVSSAGRPKSASWQERFLRFDTSPGETVMLSLPHVSEQIEPLCPVESQCHFFGKKSNAPASWLGPGDDGKNP